MDVERLAFYGLLGRHILSAVLVDVVRVAVFLVVIFCVKSRRLCGGERAIVAVFLLHFNEAFDSTVLTSAATATALAVAAAKSESNLDRIFESFGLELGVVSLWHDGVDFVDATLEVAGAVVEGIFGLAELLAGLLNFSFSAIHVLND